MRIRKISTHIHTLRHAHSSFHLPYSHFPFLWVSLTYVSSWFIAVKCSQFCNFTAAYRIKSVQKHLFPSFLLSMHFSWFHFLVNWILWACLFSRKAHGWHCLMSATYASKSAFQLPLWYQILVLPFFPLDQGEHGYPRGFTACKLEVLPRWKQKPVCSSRPLCGACVCASMPEGGVSSTQHFFCHLIKILGFLV